MEYPFAAQVLRQDATVIWLLEKLYPVNARAALSDTQPAADQPTGMPELDGWAAEEVALELVVLAERTDVMLAAEEDRADVDEETGMATLVVVVGLAEEDTDDDVEDTLGTPEEVRRVSRAGPPQISFSAKIQINSYRVGRRI